MSLDLSVWASHSRTLGMTFGLCGGTATFQTYGRKENEDIKATWFLMGNSSDMHFDMLDLSLLVLHYITTLLKNMLLVKMYSANLFVPSCCL